MSASSYYRTQDEWSADCNVSPRMLRNYITAFPDKCPKKRKSGWPKLECQDFVNMAKSQGLQGDGSLKDKKTLKEIEHLEIKIQMSKSDLDEKRKLLVNQLEAEAEYKRELMEMRKVIDDWEAHETAKHPEHAEQITALAESLCNRIKDRVAE